MTVPNSFTPGTTISSDDVNENFTNIENYLGYAEVTSDQSTTPGANTWGDLSGLSATVTVPSGGRKVKITAFAPSIKCAGSAGGTQVIGIREGSTVLNMSVMQINTTNYNVPACAIAVVTPSAGSHTYKVSLMTSTTSAVQTENVSATSPSFILVEQI